MKEHGIIFTGDSVPGIIDGRKTQTRRVVKPVRGFEHNNVCRPDMAAEAHAVWWHGEYERVGCRQECPYGAPGDRLWVRERWAVGQCADTFKPRELHPGTWKQDNGGLWYEAGSADPTHPISPRGRWRSSRFMPRWASRLTLEITDVRVERVQGISEEDAVLEGFAPDGERYMAIPRFRDLWDSLNAKRGYGWKANPWVWALTFERVAA